ncbi:MAG: hypothetical protein HC778_08990 [Chamaesiphon sp. CSU_1_12]|nr:hypothetical protein [Chamaesiphon sp. CSU_1_12]
MRPATRNRTNKSYRKQATAKNIIFVPRTGVTVTFDKAREIVKKVWLDNSSIIGLDSDTDIDENKATAIHVREIDAKPINKVEKTRRPTTLTVITEDRNKNRQVYLFNIVVDGNRQYDGNTALVEYTSADRLNADRIIKNINLARAQKLISPEIEMASQQLIDLLNSGMDVEEAAQKVKLSPRFLRAMNK